MLDIPQIEYFKGKNTWCGSRKGKRCRIAPTDKLSVYIWPEPYAFDKTPENVKEISEFDFSPEGLLQLKKFLDDKMD